MQSKKQCQMLDGTAFFGVARAKVRACPGPWRLLTIPECAFWHFR